jgi:hypothetical protein
MHKKQTMEQAKVKKGTLKRDAREQTQQRDRSAELMISRPPTCGNRNHPKGNNPWEWARNKAIGHQKDIHNTICISSGESMQEDQSIRIFTFLKVRNARTAVDANHHAPS